MPAVELADKGLVLSEELVDQACGKGHWVVGLRWSRLWDGEDAGMRRQAKWLPAPPDTVEVPEVMSVVGNEDQPVPSCIRELPCIIGSGLSSIHGAGDIMAEPA
jgi:hypothetical protein